jgi:hypothetical protein
MSLLSDDSCEKSVTREKRRNYDSVAQSVEHYTFNVRVLGSNPSGITDRKIKDLKVAQSSMLERLFCF